MKKDSQRPSPEEQLLDTYFDRFEEYLHAYMRNNFCENDTLEHVFTRLTRTAALITQKVMMDDERK